MKKRPFYEERAFTTYKSFSHPRKLDFNKTQLQVVKLSLIYILLIIVLPWCLLNKENDNRIIDFC